MARANNKEDQMARLKILLTVQRRGTAPPVKGRHQQNIRNNILG